MKPLDPWRQGSRLIAEDAGFGVAPSETDGRRCPFYVLCGSGVEITVCQLFEEKVGARPESRRVPKSDCQPSKSNTRPKGIAFGMGQKFFGQFCGKILPEFRQTPINVAENGRSRSPNGKFRAGPNRVPERDGNRHRPDGKRALRETTYNTSGESATCSGEISGRNSMANERFVSVFGFKREAFRSSRNFSVPRGTTFPASERMAKSLLHASSCRRFSAHFGYSSARIFVFQIVAGFLRLRWRFDSARRGGEDGRDAEAIGLQFLFQNLLGFGKAFR